MHNQRHLLLGAVVSGLMKISTMGIQQPKLFWKVFYSRETVTRQQISGLEWSMVPSDALFVLINCLQDLMAAVQFEMQHSHPSRDPAAPQSDTAAELSRLVSYRVV